ncbi:hypothetical protein Acr_09g0001590 [Actinidia rufa]|uniref:Uncharacterized protein n=1 Tax=Actinidia rufa TaxID=165716 RepID=A0A7J0F540_9ERIC|nr:hypothetical protein Acr_09g0001590 [Actinidia rufa]
MIATFVTQAPSQFLKNQYQSCAKNYDDIMKDLVRAKQILGSNDYNGFEHLAGRLYDRQEMFNDIIKDLVRAKQILGSNDYNGFGHLAGRLYDRKEMFNGNFEDHRLNQSNLPRECEF